MIMQRHRRSIAGITLAAAAALTVAGAGHAQALWKYTDKDGKVTYSDKAPKKGENAQLVTNDPAANVIESQRNTREGAPQKSQEVKNRAAESDQLRDALDAARAELDEARIALEKGREPLPNEVQIVVGRTPSGAATGVNSVIRKPEYYLRIAALEEAIKNAEDKVESAERSYRRSAP
jgi:hypothetical protein